MILLSLNRRASRNEFLLVYFSAFLVLILAGYLGGMQTPAKTGIYQFAVLSLASWPLASTAVRRVNDFTGNRTPLILWLAGTAGLFLLIPDWSFLDNALGQFMRTWVPFIWLIPTWLILRWLLTPPTAGPNKYGPNPHEVTP